MRGDVTGLHVPTGSNPNGGLNNLFVMNINSAKLIRIAVRPASTRRGMKGGEGRRGPPTMGSLSAHVRCLSSPSLFLSFSLHSSSPKRKSRLPVLSELALSSSPSARSAGSCEAFNLSALPFTFPRSHTRYWNAGGAKKGFSDRYMHVYMRR